MSISEEMRIKKAHISLMKHPKTALYSGVVLMGKSTVVDDNITAYTNGIDKKYGRAFVSSLTDAELRALVLHENLHVALQHMGRFKRVFKENPQLVNVSADYVVNDIIVSMEEPNFVKLPNGGLYDEKFHDWSVNEVYKYLKQEQENNPESTQGLETLDEHDHEQGQSMTPQEQQAMSDKIEQALREGSILASRLGSNQPRSVTELLEPKVDWRDVLRDFVTSSTRGTDEYTWRKYNKRLVANDIYMPSMEDETVGELIIAIDTSGSIGETELRAFASELASICQNCVPEKVRVLWWDTDVHTEQVFEPTQYQSIAELLKPQGGGGTDVECVARYLAKQKIEAEAIIVFTDGYFFDKPEWNISYPTLWVCTETTKYLPSVGTVVKQDLEETV